MSESDRRLGRWKTRLPGDGIQQKSRSVARRLTQPFEETTLSGLVYEMRPWQWYKQSILFVALIFSGNLLNFTAWVQTVQGVIAFSLVASGVYVYNDITDVEEDRNHPEKRERPIASGQVRISVAAVFGGLLILGGFGLAYALDWLFFVVVVAYLGQNVLYSLYLKTVVFLDIILIAIGFVLRAMAGVFAISVQLSPWLIICTFLAALLLAIGKRKSELEAVEDPTNTRGVLSKYTATELNNLMVIVMAALLMSYTLYTVLGTRPTKMLTLPFAYFGVFWYHHALMTTDRLQSPEELLFELPFLLNLLLWTVTVIAIIYGLSVYVPGLIV